MATADELLSRSVSGDDKTLVVDNYLRTINIPKGITNLGVESDDDVLELNFKLPRYFGTIDLSVFSIRVNYLNAKGESDIFTVNKPTIGADAIAFTWLVGPNATLYKGNTKFNVCLRIVNAEGIIDKEFNTTPATLPVLEGLEVDEGAVAEYSDLLEQWRRELFGIGDTEEAAMRAVSQEEQENITKKGAEVLATIPEEYQETANAAQEGIRTKADAIVCSAQGNPIVVSDGSDNHIRGLRVFGKTTQVSTTGKNLFDPECLINAGWSKYNETYWGTSSALSDLCPVIAFKPGTQYTISTWGHGSSSGDVSIFMYVHYADGTMVTAMKIAADRTPKYYTYTTAEGKTVDYVRFSYGYNQKSSLWDTMIEEGASATAYEPFSNGLVSPAPDFPRPLVSIDTTNVTVAGKNLASNGTDRVATILNGVTFTITKDSSEFIIGGTQDGTRDASGTLAQNILLTSGTYTISVTGLCRGDYVNVQRMNGDNGYAVTGVTEKIPKTFTIRENTIVLIQMVVLATSTYNNTPLTVQLEVSPAVTEYEPYKVKQSTNISRTLAGVPVASDGNYIDANGQQWICDEIDFERGMYIQRIGKMTCIGDTSEYWSYQENIGVQKTPVFVLTLSKLNTIRESTDRAILCENYRAGAKLPISDCEFWPKDTYFGVKQVAFRNDAFTSLDSWKQHLVNNPINLIYELTTPIETPLTAEELAVFKALHTNYPNTTVINDSGATMELKYNADTKTYIDNKVKDIPPVDNTGGLTDEQIAAALREYLAQHPITGSSARIAEVVLLSSKWGGSNSPYSQVVQIAGVTENTQVDLTPSIEQLAIFHDKDLSFVTENDGGVVTVYALGDKPANDYTIQVTMTEVYV